MKILVLALRRRILRSIVFLGIANIFLFNAAAANLSLHQLFSSHMVLQRDVDAPIWGWGTPGATVTVVVKDQNAAVLQTKTAVVNPDGSWQTTVGPFSLVANNAAYTIVVSCPGQATISLTDVLIGDVWLCTGQSNMAYSLNVIGVTNLAEEIADSVNYPNVRNFTVPNVSSSAPQTNIPSGSWQVAGPSTTGNFTATGYFTAREIYKQQGIPIGIINSAWPGSEIDSWLDPDFVSRISDFTQPVFDQVGQTPGRDTISGPYNAMIAPIAPLAIKAVEWYQGEYNVSWPEQYSRLLPGLMAKWRLLFNQPNLPFIIIQLPNFGGGQTQPVESGSWAELREAQLKTVLNDAHARIVTAIDIGHGDLHPTDKQDVGLRASWAAATLVYGQSRVDQGPILTSVTISGHNIICTFDHVGAGLITGTKTLSPLSPVQQVMGGTPANFAICGANKVFFAGNASITASNQVTVSSPSVSAPVAVRYAWGNNPPCNLYASMVDGGGTVTNGIPAGPGRSDPVNRLLVNFGTGTGYYASNATVSITASNLTGETFHHWSGDTNFLSAIGNAAVTVTQAMEYVSVLANFQITGAPSGLAASSSSSQVMLSWNSMAATHYNLKRSTVSGGPYTIVTPNIVSANYIDSSAAIGTTYYYVVSATNLLNEGPNSAQVSIVPNNGRPYYWTNTWDANAATLPNPADGSGSWSGSQNWWDGGTNLDGDWTSTSPNSAIFGAGTSGNYKVDLGGGTIYASNILFNSSSYTLTNGTLIIVGATTPVIVNSGATAVMNNALTVSSSTSLKINAGGTLSLAGGASFAGNLSLIGGGTADFSAGTFSGPNFAFWAQTPVTQEAATLNSVRIMIGYGGNSTYTMNDPAALASSTGGGGDSFIGRAGNTGVWDLKQGTVNLTTISGDNLRVALDVASKGTLNVEGGTFNLGNNSLYINSGGTSSGGAGTVNLSGGTLNTASIQFGGGVAYGAGTSAALKITGGTLYVGSGGILFNYTGSLTTSFMASGGVIGAAAAWSSMVPIVLTNLNGDITFQAADPGNAPKNISLSGALSGPGGLIKTGGGTLTLSGANTFTGQTTIKAGTLSLIATNNSSRAYVNDGGILNVKLANAGNSLPASSIVFGTNNSQMTFDFVNFGNTTAPIVACGDLILQSNVVVNVSNAPASGTSVLFSYSGTRSGPGIFTGGALPAGASIVDDLAAKTVSLTYLPAHLLSLSSSPTGSSGMRIFGTGGAAFSSYRILSSTNLGLPITEWQPIWTNTFDAAGNFDFNALTNFPPSSFYRLVTP